MATSGASNGLQGPAGNSDPRQGLGSGFEGGNRKVNPGQPAVDASEEKLVTKFWREYEEARKFDEPFRKQVAIDRRYAAGTSDLSWAVTTNLIGAFIDILVSLLYARDPDVSVRKSPQVDESNTRQAEQFAKTLEIVISSLWKKGKLRKAARKDVRSILSNGEGWLKCTIVSDKTPQPEVETALNDARVTMARLVAQQKLIDDPDAGDSETKEAEMAEKEALIQTLQEKIEVAVSHMFVIDYVQTENMQVSVDVASIEDYLDADWIGNEMYMKKDDALASFPDLTAEDLDHAKQYYQRAPKEKTTREMDGVFPQGVLTAESAQNYTTSTSAGESPPFLRIVESWNRTDKQVRTVVDGLKKWAKAPYTPAYPASRFYPYFYCGFFEVDGERHAQSLSWRLYKLQDEYSSVRSNFRLTRQRSIPATLFNASLLDSDEADKIASAKEQEYVGVRTADNTIPIGNIFAAKPTSPIDPRLYDPTYILNDMERISGVQEALSSAINGPGNPRTATEANIQQSGTNARTTSDRDMLEWMLTDLAQYTAEQALQCLQVKDVQRICGPKAFWPAGMDIEDLFTLVEVDIEAGTTGKPKSATDQQAWATILPLIKETIQQIEQALASGNVALADALTELIKETMLRLGDETDPERFIPKVPPPGSPGSNPAPAPVMPQISISLKGEIDGQTALELAQPAVAQDAKSAAPPAPPPSTAPGAAPASGLPPAPSLAAPAPGQ